MSSKLKNGIRFVVPLLFTLIFCGANISCAEVVLGPEGGVSRINISLGSSGELPTINSLDANPPSISAGDTAVIGWNVSGATEVTIDQGIGNVAPIDSIEVSPTATITYTLTATNAVGTVTKLVTVTVAGTSLVSLPPSSPPPPSLPVINSFTANPTSINTGYSATLSWDVSGATSIAIAPGAASVPASGSATASPSFSTTYTLTATNSVGSVNREVTVTVTESSFPPPASPSPPPPPSATPPAISYFNASPESINAGEGTTLGWNVFGATMIQIDGGVGQLPYTSGYATVRPFSTTTYTLTAVGPGGMTSRSVTVTVAAAAAAPTSLPVINSFTANPTSVNAGGSSNLSWNVSGAASVFLDHGGGYVSASGNATARPSSTTTYTLTASNAAGSVIRTATVTVAAAAPTSPPVASSPPPPSLPVVSSFTASPASITAGGNSTLSWSVSGATSVSINQGVGSVPASGSATAKPGATITYTLTATNAAGSVTRTASVTVAAAPPPSPPPPVDASACEQALFNAVNALRASNGKAALSRNAYIDGLCRQHAQYMASHAALSHDNSSSRCSGIYSNVPGMHACAENVLQNSVPCNATVMGQQWFNSPGHKTNMLNAVYTVSGMGIAIDSSGKIWACQMFAGP